VDVGANRGRWTRAALTVFPDARFLLVEPQERLNPFLKDLTVLPNVELVNVGISDEEGVLPLELPDRDDTASFLSSGPGVHPTCEVPVTTLDALVSETSSFPDICKIDAEGYDLKVLQGARRLLGKTEVFLVEAAVCAPGIDNTVDRVLAFMSENGYRLFDITDLNRTSRHETLWLVELVFVHQDSRVWDRITSYEG
jgi:FkbM family methyltransferase